MRDPQESYIADDQSDRPFAGNAAAHRAPIREKHACTPWPYTTATASTKFQCLL